MLKGSQEHSNWYYQWTLDAFCEFEFCGYVVYLCRPRLSCFSIPLILYHLITRMYILRHVKFQWNWNIVHF